MTSRGTATATLHYSYTAAFGGGSGTGTDTLQAGRQLIVSDAITYLKFGRSSLFRIQKPRGGLY
ncbi:MAG: hypothetical protein U0V70_17545 [Terriglobia bacterium]